MALDTICIIGEGELKERLKELLVKANFNVIAADLSQDYAEQACDADLVVESVAEDLALKRKVFADCDAKCHKGTILATTTSNSWVTKLAAATKRPDKIVGLNFTKSLSGDKYLVQIVRGLQTSDSTARVSEELLERAGVAAVRVAESPGLILDRVVASIVNEACVMYSARLATIEDIDRMMKVCVNWPMGPFEFADYIGVDRVVAILECLSRELGPKYLPNFLLKKMIDAGWLGRKTGRGFYVYDR